LSIPGSVLLNISAGILFNVYIAFSLVCVLTTAGACCAYIISNYLLRSLVQKWFPDRLRAMDETVKKNQGELLYFLIFLRLVPMTPNWFLNLASPILNIPLTKFMLSVFIGLMPYHFICVRAGSILSQIESLNQIFNLEVMAQLLLLAFLSFVPVLIKKYMSKNKDKQQ